MNNTEDHIEPQNEAHEGPIKTPKQLIVTVILAFIVPVIVIFLIIRFVLSTIMPSAGSDTLSPEAIASRIKPVAGFALVDASAPKQLQTGEQVYQSTCAACHDAGVAGAPPIGNADAWAPGIQEGYEHLLQIALHGQGAMPAKGGNPNLADIEVERAMVYMANQSGASFDEPAEPAEGEEVATTDTQEPAQPEPEQATPQTTESSPPDADQAEAPAQTQQAEAADEAAAEAPAQAEGQADQAPTETAAVDPAGEKLYNSACFACHNPGVAQALGSPPLGDKAAWEPLLAKGEDALLQVVINGKGAMPPRGGTQASDEELRAAVQYMMQQAQ